MTRDDIIEAAAKLETAQDLLSLLNSIKKDDLGGEDRYPFEITHFNYFRYPSKNVNSYRTFSIPKKSGGKRVISAPIKQLKSILRYCNILLQSLYVAPECVTGFVPGKSIVDNAERHLGMEYVFNTDLKDFFPSISNTRIKSTLKLPPFRFNDEIAETISGLCCTEVFLNGKKRWVLPQGSPCSPVLTNIVCRSLDWKLNGLAKRFGVEYSRYADDITFSSHHNVYQKNSEFLKEMRRIISEQRFTINENKTRLQKKGQRQEVTGLIVSDRVNVEKRFVRGIDNLLYIWEKYGRLAAYSRFLAHYTPKCNRSSSIPGMEAVLGGKLLYLRMVKGEDNPTWSRLQRRFDLLTGNQTNNGADTTYLMVFTIEAFEKAVGASLEFDFENNQALSCSFQMGATTVPVRLSKYIRTRFTNILSSPQKEKEFALAKKYYHIGYCKSDDYFWLLFRHKPRVTQAKGPYFLSSIQKEALNSILRSDPADDQEGSTESLGMDILKEYIDSGFELNVFDKWTL